jgi:hypothetical protein
MLQLQIATSDEMRELLLNPPDVSPWNATGLFKPPQPKKKTKLSAAWSSKRVTIHRKNISADDVQLPHMTEEEQDQAYRAARAEARANRRAAVIAEANLGLDMSACTGSAADVQGDGLCVAQSSENTVDKIMSPAVVDRAAVARMASIIQVNVKKETPAFGDDTLAEPPEGAIADDGGQRESAPLAAASIETWGGLVMRCSEAGSSVHAVDFGSATHII